MLNPIWLKTFTTLIETGHFTQTAEKLFMTQPGVSQQIKKLEQACGYSLIKRVNKQFEITEQGRLVYEHAQRMAQQEIELIENLAFDDPYSGQCRLSCSGALALLYYPKLLKLQQEHPALAMHLEAAPNYRILKDITEGTIDIGVVTQLPNLGEFNFEAIGLEPLCLIMPKQYQNRVIDPQCLMQCGVVNHPDAAHYLSRYFELCANPELAQVNINQLPMTSYVNQLSQILLPISQGLGFTVLPKSALDSFADRDQLHVHSPDTAVTESLYLVSKRNRELAARYLAVKNILKASHSIP
ncbi:LysR family transcriptional regulator [Shewanella pealeana]|uniref:Transcriptional regulator, LysR family n=1 Tax=Shewanella pealeana (strain ATCC 700345 / ANG-SQ1) TaxID=398579 RepID=A8H318_SHEPA|nr:LysR family transcriptional regulator [Shewanella pealeana]ABV86955.1 transcriptional regulator, LysR family [Shewanella pealeana ATCC 700345]